MMIGIQEIPVERIEEFWPLHIKYLVEDGIIEDGEDVEYFSGEEYRSVIKAQMCRDNDRHRMVYFVRNGERIGAAQFNIYHGEDGKCFILDFWVFPRFRGGGTGHECFESLERYTRALGARRYEINSTKEASVRFWKSLGFVENGCDEDGMPLFVRS